MKLSTVYGWRGKFYVYVKPGRDQVPLLVEIFWDPTWPYENVEMPPPGTRFAKRDAPPKK
jgi:hypothetical protein